jgi:hypothetical protein
LALDPGSGAIMAPTGPEQREGRGKINLSDREKYYTNNYTNK